MKIYCKCQQNFIYIYKKKESLPAFKSNNSLFYLCSPNPNFVISFHGLQVYIRIDKMVGTDLVGLEGESVSINPNSKAFIMHK